MNCSFYLNIKKCGAFLLLMVMITSVFAQETPTRIKGTVLSADDGQPIIGASVKIKKSGRVVMTGLEGDFSAEVEPTDFLVISSLGFKTEEVSIADKKEFNIRLGTSDLGLKEVVVTALGISREEKALGYSVTKVDGEDLTNSLSNNWSDALTGKVAGLNIIKSGAGPAGSSKIILRGESSLSGDNEALIVVDGVVISQSSGKLTGNGQGNYLDGDSPVDFGSSMADLNPEDIESVTVLKGPGAAALYGARGANGAIIITTKQGKSNKKGLGVSINSNTSFATINRWPDYQYEYGQGGSGGDLYYSYGQTEDGPSTYSTSSAWGPKFDGQLYYQYNPDNYRASGTVRTPWVAYPNQRKDFFETAQTYTNSITVSGGTAKTSARLSYTNVNNKWIIPNTGYNRNTVALQLNHNVSDKLKISSKVNFNNRYSDNLPGTGYNNQTIMYFMRGLNPNIDIDWLKDYWVPGQEGINQLRPFSLQLDNPYLISYEMLNKTNRNGVIGNVSATYDFTKEWSLMVRTSMDFMAEDRSQQRPKSTQKYADGMYREQTINSQEQNSDFLLSYKNNRMKDFKFNSAVGGSLMSNKYRRDEYRAEKLILPNIYNLANSALNLESRPYRAQYATNSLYGLAAVAYKDFLFLDVTGRNDWTSTLYNKETNREPSFFYYSVNMSTSLVDAFELPSLFSFFKLRASYAEVGSGGVTPYLVNYNYGQVTNFPGGLAAPTRLASDLNPERTHSLEFGTDIRMFKNRLGIDVAVYQNTRKDQIITPPVDPASGYLTMAINAGTIRNRGLEVQLNGDVFKSKKGFNWNVFGNFSLNRNKVLKLSDNFETQTTEDENGQIITATSSGQVLSTIYGSRGSIEARVGGSLGDMYGLGYKRSPDGQIVYDETGSPVMGSDLIYLGNYVPKWKAGLGHQFRYKQFGLNVLFDAQFGGVAYSLTHAVSMEEGKVKKTIPGRYNGIIGDGVIQNPDGTYRKNDVVATNIREYYYAHYNRDNLEANVLSTDFIKFREARFDYSFPAKTLKKLNIQKATIGVYGRDLFVFTKWAAWDPEFGTLADGEITSGAEVAQFPSTRSFGLNLTISF